MTQQRDISGSTCSINDSADSQPDQKEKQIDKSGSHPTEKNNNHADTNTENYSSEHYSKLWHQITSDNRLTLFGFRRYRTTHLLNLRFIEAEIDRIDHDLFQAGLQLGQPVDRYHIIDRLGLKQAKVDSEQVKAQEIVNRALITRLRELIKEYDESLKNFNTIMRMETFSLADDTNQSDVRQDLNSYEKFKTRMLRIDLPLRHDSRDPIQHFLRKGLRRLWYSLNFPKPLRAQDEEQQQQQGRIRRPPSKVMASWDRKHQNTARIAEVVTRFVIAMITGAALVAPMILLSYQTSQKSRLLTVIIFVSCFCFLLSVLSKASNYETMAASAAYAAVLTVFVSNSPHP